ncbi:MAG: TonB-dependent receptor domain-containing protein, partial [Gemmatimonadota bacterium]
QALAEVGDGIALNAGARLDDNEAFGTFATYRAGIAYTLATGTRLHVGAGTGFKEPTILESFATGFAVGNPSLEPERSTSREAGVEQALLDGRIALAGTYYDQRFEDLIQFTASPAEPGDPNFFNVAAATASGVELDATVAAGGGLRFTARYGYTATEVTNPGFDSGPDAAYVDGDPLLRRPAHTAGASLGYRPAGRVALHAGARYVGERDDRDFSTIPATRVTLEPYTLVDLGGGLTVLEGGEGGPGLTITARVANVFDVDYREVANFETPGRTVLVGARFGAGR